MKPLPISSAAVAAFRSSFFTPGLPCRFARGEFSFFPAISTWIRSDGCLDRDYLLGKIGEPYRLVSVEFCSPGGKFHRQEIPFIALLEYLCFSKLPKSLPTLYLAQAQLLDIFPELRPCFEPTPELVTSSGKGDIYAVNLWLGRGHTNTPLHKDPNPNLFVQVAGKKKLRIFEPEIGRGILDSIGINGQRFRLTDAYMAGESKDVMDRTVWSEYRENGYEVEVEAGDGCFIPAQWWHAVVSMSEPGYGISCSINWWFR